jgi:hypothetical protein
MFKVLVRFRGAAQSDVRFTPKADIRQHDLDVRFVPEADMVRG